VNTVEQFGFAPSTYVRTARLVCEEKGIEYRLAPLEFRAESHRGMHPFLKMPTLRHGDVTLYETLAIATYLNEEFPGSDLEAGAGLERARMFQWISVANDYLYDGVVGAFAGSKKAGSKAIEAAKSLLEPVDRALASHPYLAGDELTLANLFVLPMVLFADQAVGSSRLLSTLPDIAEWRNRLASRPSVVSTED
jgi:glutathione S-transferase